MSSDLPLKIRVDIRDNWNAKEGALQLAVDDLAKSLGYTIKPEAEWPALWNSLNGNFSDKATFVPSITRLTVTWYQQLATRIERDDQSQWTEKLLENLSQAGTGFSNTLWVQPSASSDRLLQSRWDKDFKKFYMEIPKSMNPRMSGIDYDFERDFDQYFSPAATPTAAENLAGSLVKEPRIRDDVGDWADIVIETHKATAVPATNKSTSLGKPMRMPSVDTTPRPSDLLKRTAPLYLIFNAGTFPAWIQCSHEPTLTFLAEYLKKHAKTNINDSERRPIYKTGIEESNFSHGLRDFMTIDSYMNLNYGGGHTLNPTLILTLIEGVLGYQRVKNSGGYWIFRHETGFT